MKIALSVLLLLSVAALAVAAGGGTTNPGGPKCTLPIVRCLMNPCRVTGCKLNPRYTCVANFCGGCKTDWRNKATGALLVNTCPPRPLPVPSSPRGPIITIPDCSKGPCHRRSLHEQKTTTVTRGGGTTNPGGPKCTLPIVQCLVNPCTVTQCTPNPLYKCEANYCGGCKTDWRRKATGKLLVNTCPPRPPVPSPRRCICPDLFAPVCANGITFGNYCLAACAGYTDYTKGACGDLA